MSIWLPLISLFFVVAILAMGFWIWALVDCVQNEPSEGNDKVIWLLIIIFLNGLGALIYCFVRRPERIAQFGK